MGYNAAMALMKEKQAKAGKKGIKGGIKQVPTMLLCCLHLQHPTHSLF
jgi:hypothetical protein